MVPDAVERVGESEHLLKGYLVSLPTSLASPTAVLPLDYKQNGRRTT